MINNVVEMGRLTAKPELRQTQNGKCVTSFNIAVDRRYKNGDEKSADFIPCVSWGKTAEFITKYFGKGDMIAVTGEIQTREYTDNNGNKRMWFEVLINNASFCGSKNNNNQQSFNNAQPAFQEIQEMDEDLPF